MTTGGGAIGKLRRNRPLLAYNSTTGGILRRSTGFSLKNGLVVLVTLTSLLVLVFRAVLFGHGPTWKGGEVGRRWDNSLRRFLFSRTVQLQRTTFHTLLGFPLPICPDKAANLIGAPVLTQSWLFETLTRAKKRQMHLEQYLHGSDNNTHTASHSCTKCLRRLQPNVGEWYHPIKHVSTLDPPLLFDRSEMESFLSVEFGTMYRTTYPYLSQYDQVQLWGLCAVAYYGGIFTSPQIRSLDALGSVAMDVLHSRKDCDSKFWLQSTTGFSIHWVASTPFHPHLMCVLRSLEYLTDPSQLIPWTLRQLEHTDLPCALKCCRPGDGCMSKEHSCIILPVMPCTSSVPTNIKRKDAPRFEVQINERTGTDSPDWHEKARWSRRLEIAGCEPGWFCNRCLRIPWLGNLRACKLVCRTCYQSLLCTERTGKDVEIVVTVQERTESTQKRIPRVIHQTWFEELSTQRYPHLQRMQNSWIASGWEYRFYTDDEALRFIQQYYPTRVVQAYETVLPGAFKADLFRLLVLLKVGGIYADIDVQLDVHLDQFVTTDLSFFVPRDVPLDFWPGANYCVWNGLLGAAPGHPLIAKAVEDLLNRILNRQDYYDIEGYLCHRNLASEIWKLRVLPILLLTGPCALGMSMNSGLGNSNLLEGWELGWQQTGNISFGHDPPDHYWGETIVLLTDRNDMGELRFTDVDRNLLVASSNPDQFAREPVAQETDKPKKGSVHYSKAETEIVGEHGIYLDENITNELIRVRIIHLYAE